MEKCKVNGTFDGKEGSDYFEDKDDPSVQMIEERSKDNPVNLEILDNFNYKDFVFMLEYENGKLLDNTTLLLEFFYLLITRSYKLAILLLSQDYAVDLRSNLNKIFLEDDDKILR